MASVCLECGTIGTPCVYVYAGKVNSFQNREKEATGRLSWRGALSIYRAVYNRDRPNRPKNIAKCLDGTDGTGPVAYRSVYVQGYILI